MRMQIQAFHVNFIAPGPQILNKSVGLLYAYTFLPPGLPNVYQKGGRRAWGTRGVEMRKFGLVYQMSTNLTFLRRKRRFSFRFLRFLDFLAPCKECDTALTGQKCRIASKILGKMEKFAAKR